MITKIEKYQLIWDVKNKIGTLRVRFSGDTDITRMSFDRTEEFLAVNSVLENSSETLYDTEKKIFLSDVQGMGDEADDILFDG